MKRRLLFIGSALLLGSAVLLTSSCSQLRYFGQALSGHWQITRARQPIDELLAAPETPPTLRERLQLVKEIRGFAIGELGLPDSGSYTDYADIGRETTVWLVTAAPELSLQAHTWCYPFVGCLAYRGYFRRELAEAEAERWRAQGYETALSPAVAYSTLGFMDDPVLSTMLRYSDSQLAGLLFHELAHEVVFVRGDTEFNESFASTVEKVGQSRWEAARGASPRPREILAQRQAQFNELLLAAREALDEVYALPVSAEEKRALKAEAQACLVQAYERMREDWGGWTGYDPWFADGPPNNAHLALIASYERLVPAFEALLAEQGDDLSRFYAAVEALADASEESRRAALEARLQTSLKTAAPRSLAQRCEAAPEG